MSSCYICGETIPKGEVFRVNLNTGSSSGVSGGITGRNIRFSAREYTSRRSVCYECFKGMCKPTHTFIEHLKALILLVFGFFFVRLLWHWYVGTL